MRFLCLRPVVLLLPFQLAPRLAASQASAPAAPQAATQSSAPSVRFTGYLQARETYRDGDCQTGGVSHARGERARYGSDSTRYGLDVSLEYQGAALKGEYIGQHRDAGTLDDKGWYAQGTDRVLPWIQLVLKQEDFRRSEISEALRNRATTGGVNVEFAGGKPRLLADYVSRKIGTPGVRQGLLIMQAQVKF